MQPFTKPSQKPARRAFQDGGAPGSLLMGQEHNAPTLAFESGGKIKGPGTTTSDSIPAQVRETGEPIQVSTGERIVSAAQDALLQKIAKARGYKSVDQMFEVETGKPVGPTIKGGKKAAEFGKPPVDDLAKRVNQIPGGGTAPSPDGYDNGNDFTRNVNNSLNALGGMGVVASVPLKAAQAVQAGQGAVRTAMNAAPVLQNGIPRLAAPTAKAAQAAPDFVAGASGVQRVGGANLPAVIQNTGIPITKATNVALQEGAKANQMAAGVRSFGNASAGAGMLDGQQQRPPGQMPSQSTPETSPIVSGVANTGAPPAANARAQRVGDPSSPDLNDEFSNAMIENRNPGGKVKKVVGADGRTTYSGSNVSGDVSFQGADGNALPGRPGGGFMLMNGMSQDAIKQTLTNPDGSAWSAGDNAIMAANIRDGVDPNRGTSRGGQGGVSGFGESGGYGLLDNQARAQRNASVSSSSITDGLSARQRRQFAQGDQNIALKGRELDNAMTTSQMRNATDIRGQDIQDKRNSEANQIARGNLGVNQGQLGLSREEYASKAAKDKQATDAQAAYLNAKTPAEKEAAKQKMIALGLLKTSTPTYHPGSKLTDGLGNQTVTEGAVFNPDTGEVRFVGNDKTPSLPPGMTKQVGTSGGKPVYEDANGNRFQ